jgi:hypothetical protein
MVGWRTGGSAASREVLSRKDPKVRHAIDVRLGRGMGELLDFIRVKTPSDHMKQTIKDYGKKNQIQLVRDILLRTRKPDAAFLQHMLGMAHQSGTDFLDMVPMTLKLQGKPMDVAGRRPLFAPLFQREKRTRRDIYKCARQVSKPLALDTPIPTPEGWKTMGDLQVGDQVFGEDGFPTSITHTSAVMEGRDCFEITFDAGHKVVADHDHPWLVHTSGRWSRVMTTEEMIAYLPKKKKSTRIYIESAKPLNLPEADLLIHPYVLGTWLGDGYSADNRMCSSVGDAEETRKNQQDCGAVLHPSYTSAKGLVMWSIAEHRDKLVRLNLLKNKHIPPEYLRASFQQRLDLLAGLMDTDGCALTNGRCEFSQKEGVLVQQVTELLSTLGIKHRTKVVTIRGRNYVKLRFCTKLPLFRLKRKLTRQQAAHGHPKNTNHYPVSILATKSVPVRCIRVDNHSHLFLCGRAMIPTHNTTNANAVTMMDMIWREMFRTMYVVPLAIYATRLHHIHMNPMIRACRLPIDIQDRGCVNNVNEKTFTSGGHYHGVSCFNSAGNALGLAIDRLIFDEIQDLNLDFVPQIRETLRTSDYRWESYFGTARGVENTIQVLFDESSQGEWNIKCGRCGLWVEPTKEKHAISMIQRHGIACPDCRTLLDVSKGEWVHQYPSRLYDDDENGVNGFAGYHIPATVIRDLITPYDRYLGTIYDKLHGLSRYSEAKFLQEVLGISSDQGGRPITTEEIKNASTLNFGPNGEGINLDRYSNIGGGQDWGGSEITSFTIGTLLGLTIDGKFECLGAIRPTGIPDNERHLPMAAWFRKIGKDRITVIGGDAGFVGSVQNRNLQSASGVMVAHITYGTQKHFFKPVPMSNNFIVDRTTLIYIAYTMIRNGLILFPKDQWFETFSEDLKATYIEDTESPTGISSRRYSRYRQKSDDFLHALGYAVFVCAITSPSPIDLPSLVGLGENFSMSARTSQQIEEIGEEDGFVFSS